MIIRNNTRHCELAHTGVLADTPLTRMKGLLGRSSFENGQALVIVPCQSVHMLFMRFAIDVIFVDKNGAVIGCCPYLKPFAFSPIFWKSACAIELPAGTIDRTKTQLGDQINYQS